MVKIKFHYILLVIIALLNSTTGQTEHFLYNGDCNQYFHRIPHVFKIEDSTFGYGTKLKLRSENRPTVNPEQITELKVMSYNILNLTEHRGKWVTDPETGFKVFRSRAQEKPLHQQQGAAKAVKDVGADIIVLQEVESPAVLNSFQREHLQDKFYPFLIDGNDGRGIDIAFLVRKDLPLNYELHSFKHFKANYQGNEVSIFSRDLPMLVVTKPDQEKPIMVIFGNHLKSKRSTATDPESTLKRTLQAKAFAEVKQQVVRKYGRDIPIVLTGDFNNAIHGRHNEFTPIFQAGMKDVFDHPRAGYHGDRATHTYHPRDGPTEKGQLDGILINDAFSNQDLLKQSGIYRYKNEAGQTIPIPDTYQQRELNPSDHFPVYMTLDFQKLIQ